MAHIIKDICTSCGTRSTLDGLGRCYLCSLKPEFRAEYRQLYMNPRARKTQYPKAFWWDSLKNDMYGRD
jgi:hypothetical protein